MQGICMTMIAYEHVVMHLDTCRHSNSCSKLLDKSLMTMLKVCSLARKYNKQYKKI